MVGKVVFLEATLENRTKAPMLLDAVRMAAAEPYSAQRLDPPSAGAATPGGGPLSAYVADVALLPPEGGAFSYVFRLDRSAEAEAAGGAAVDPGGGSALGRLEIRWRGPMGDPARLQTQLITMPPAPPRDLLLSLASLPPRLAVEQPFTAEVLISNPGARALGPLKLSYSEGGAAGGGGGVVMEGPQSIVVEEVPARGSVSVGVRLLALAPGTQLLSGLMLTDERDGRVFDSLKPAEVFVHGAGAGGAAARA